MRQGSGFESVAHRVRRRLAAGIAAAAIALPVALPAATAPAPSLLDSFPLGSGGGTLCQVQANSVDPALSSMFDRSWTILCRDAAAPIGRLYALRKNGGDPAARLAPIRDRMVSCGATASTPVDDLGSLPTLQCKLNGAAVDYRVYTADRGKTLYVAEGLEGYDSALTLALRTIVADRAIPGEISVATTAASDPTAFARVQAGNLDVEQALAEGYRRNNSGSYAEAAEFFDTLLQRAEGTQISQTQLAEYIVNRALQKSNLGAFDEADGLFDQVALIPTGDPVQLRLRRNFMAMHRINQRRLDDARAELQRPLAPIGRGAEAAESNVIQPETAQDLNASAPLVRQLTGTEDVTLSPPEKAAILDAQALQLQGTIDRLQGKNAEARAALDKSLIDVMAVREGRVASIVRLRAQGMAELSAVAEAEKKYPEAEGLLRQAQTMLQTEYPRSAAVNAAKARLAAFLSRRGQTDASLALYREVIVDVTSSGGNTTGFENLLLPYFAQLAKAIPAQPALVDDFFLATETLVRPGTADTQAALARQLSGGSDEAARLFRQATSLTRDVERNRVELARLQSLATRTAMEDETIVTATAALAKLESDQVATQAQLSKFPRYRALSTEGLKLAELRQALKPDEAYFKLAVVGNAVYALYITPTDATAYQTGITAKALEKQVKVLRDSIAVEEKGELLTYPFDAKLARALYIALMQPLDKRMGGVRHLIFEPDGGMLKVPLNLLITEQAGLDAYLARTAKPDADEFDMRDVAWLGKKFQVSTAVSARAFRDVRLAARSTAPRAYLGFGQNAPVSNFVQISSNRSVSSDGGIDCNWPLRNWNHPIKATELYTAEGIIGNAVSQVVTGEKFSDTSVISKPDLDQYRILHFATHGLIAAPRPECPARPALLTSFGGPTSDGLLTFKEIYDLKLDADLVILSACDTAGSATIAATREAGVTSGGGSALDGLIRAFIGAGGRSVIASHWPAPDDFQATERLISGLFSSPPGTTIAQAIQNGQRTLMAAAETSHPYYWADFVVIGDGDQPVLRAAPVPAPAPVAQTPIPAQTALKLN